MNKVTILNDNISQEAIEEFFVFIPHCKQYVIRAEKGNSFSVCTKNKNAQIIYTSTSEFFRALSLLPLDGGDICIRERKNIKRASLMLDCSRGGVINDSNFRHLVKLLVSLVYNSLQLYTEDTYEVKGEPYFGHLRGRISIADWKKMDNYAASFGIELIPCIQVLAHLDNLFIWDEYEQIRDTENILLIDDERTYKLIDNMFASIAEAFRSRCINLGYDEAHFVGLGKYYEKHGAVNRVELILRHLKRVLDIASSYGFQCTIWSDMFFRLAYNDYYPSPDAPLLGEDIKSLIPENITLAYWDYYHTDEAIYDDMYRRHLDLNRPISFCAGAWRWLGFAPMNKYGLKRLIPGIHSTLNHKIEDVMLTVWGDDGNECSIYSALPQIVAFGELCRNSEATESDFDRRLTILCGVSFSDFMLLDLPNIYRNEQVDTLSNPAKYLFYNDPMYGLCDYHTSEKYCQWFRDCAEKLNTSAALLSNYGYIFKTEISLCQYLALKANMGNELRSLYKSNDRKALAEYANNHISQALEAFDRFESNYREQWRKEWKSFGLDNLQLRFGGQRLRLVETQRRILEYATGKVPSLEELEEPILPYRYPGEKELLYKHNYHYLATPSFRVKI